MLLPERMTWVVVDASCIFRVRIRGFHQWKAASSLENNYYFYSDDFTPIFVLKKKEMI